MVEEKEVVVSERRKTRSDDIGTLMGALAKAQGTYKKPKSNQTAPGGSFANLASILDAVRESLSLNEISFYQHVEYLDDGSGGMILETMLGHSSNQWISSLARIVKGKTDRATGNSIENHKRMHASMLLGIAPSDHDPVMFDDNFAESSMEQTLEDTRKPKSERVIDRNDVISLQRYQDLMIELDNYPEFVQSVLDTYNIETLADLPNEEYLGVRKEILNMKKADEEWRKKKRGM